MTVFVYIHLAGSVPDSYEDLADDAIDTLDDQVDESVYGVPSHSFSTGGGSWSTVESDLNDSLSDSEYDNDDAIHLAVIDNPTHTSAGKMFRQAGVDGTSGASGVNAALLDWVQSPGCWDISDGSQGFRTTVIHEVAHAMDCWHPDGEVRTGQNNNPVTPMLFWYANNNCGSNSSVDSDCGSNGTRYSIGNQLTDCTVSEFEEHANYWDL